jgi:hypothetical protein
MRILDNLLLLFPSAGNVPADRYEVDPVEDDHLLTMFIIACPAQGDDIHILIGCSSFLYVATHLGLASTSLHHAIIGPLTAVGLPVIEPAFTMAGVLRVTVQVLDDQCSLLDENDRLKSDLNPFPYIFDAVSHSNRAHEDHQQSSTIIRCQPDCNDIAP